MDDKRYIRHLTEIIEHENNCSEELYKKMQTISEKYPLNNSLKNKLDAVERILWPVGRK
jgi:hypothetical protein